MPDEMPLQCRPNPEKPRGAHQYTLDADPQGVKIKVLVKDKAFVVLTTAREFAEGEIPHVAWSYFASIQDAWEYTKQLCGWTEA